MGKYRNNIFWWGLLAVTLFMVWLVQRAIPFMMDDEWYSTLLYSDQRLQSLGDVISAQIWHFFHWGGRNIAHGILQILLLCGPFVSDICNLAAILFLSVLIVMLSGRMKKGQCIPFLCIAIASLHALNPNWKMSMYWQAGASNYLYITIIILLFLSCYTRKLEEEEKKDLPGITLFILPLGLCAGWSNENMGPAVWILTLGVIIWRRRTHRKIRPWMIEGNLACFLGSGLVILAPGNFVRAEQVASNEYGLLWNCFLRCYYVSRAAADYLFLAIILTAIVIFLNVFMLNGKLDRKEIAFLAGAVLSWGAMVLSPHYPDRATFGTMVFLVLVLFSQMGKILDNGRNVRIGWIAASAGLLLWLRAMYFLGEYMALDWGWIL